MVNIGIVMKKTIVIAEAGVNHNGSVQIAIDLIDVAVAAGADFVKFQTFKSEKTVSRYAPKAAYQMVNTNNQETQLEMVKKLEISEEDHRKLKIYCQRHNISFLSTPFDLESANFLIDHLGMTLIKIPSGEINNAPFLVQLARRGLPIILSTGMSTLGEVECALGAIAYGYLGLVEYASPQTFLDAFASNEGQALLCERVTLLHCTTEYPAPFHQINLRAMDTLKAAFGLPVGLSDHSQGVAIPIGAVARGACIVEKHFTLDRNLPGPDHRASLEPGELKEMVTGIRQVEVALGETCKRPNTAEWGNRSMARRSLVANRAISPGEIWTELNLSCKRPGSGISPLRYWDFLGQPASRAYIEDELLTCSTELDTSEKSTELA